MAAEAAGAAAPEPPIERASTAGIALLGAGWRTTGGLEVAGAGLAEETFVEPEPVRDAAAACAGSAG
jgi:hypothetical protein